MLTLVLILIVLIGGGLFALWLKGRMRRNRSGRQLLDSVFLEVLVPKDKPLNEQSKEREEEELIGVAEQLFATLASAEKHETFSFEIISQDQKTGFYINSPGHLQDLLEKQIHAQYPDAQIDPVEPPRLARGAKAAAAYELGPQKDIVFPIKTYKQMESDPLNALTNSLSKLSKEEAGAIQLIISPAGSSWQRKTSQKAREVQKGKQVDSSNSWPVKALGFIAGALSDFLTDMLSPGRKSSKEKELEQRHKEEEQKQLTPMQQETVKRLEEKASKTGFQVNLRLVVTSTDKRLAESHMRNLLSSFMQYTQSPFNGFRPIRKAKGKVIRDFVFRSFEPRFFAKMILNTEELASIFHLPTPELETPNIKWLMSKRAPAPVNAPKEGLLLGINTYRGVKTKIRVKPDDRRRHMYIIGRTGTGKSEFMKNMARQDMADGKGLAVIDPHGDLVEDILRFLPRSRTEDVVLFEPFDTSRPMGLNMLEADTEEQQDFAVQEMVAIFYKLFPPEMIGPMFEHNMRNVMLTLMADKEEPGTIAEIPRMFTDPEYQKYKLTKVTDPVVRNFWEQEMAKTSDFHKSEMLGYLISKVGRFVENEMMRNIIGQSRSAFDFREIMDEGRILLVNLSKGRTGEVNSKLLGLILVSKLQMAALSRADLPEQSRKDFYLYIDEFQNFVTDSLATILSEARKYRLNLVMAHQYISQLEEGRDTKIRDAVFGNAGTMVSFRIGVEDAEVLAKEFDPVFNQYDLVNIDQYNAYVKLMIDGTASRPFNMQTLPPPEGGSREAAEAVKRLSKLQHGRSKEEVEHEIAKRARLGEYSAKQPPNLEKTG